jgi:hypothetical protein
MTLSAMKPWEDDFAFQAQSIAVQGVAIVPKVAALAFEVVIGPGYIETALVTST